jgi:methyl-accepting chemotaxis protein
MIDSLWSLASGLSWPFVAISTFAMLAALALLQARTKSRHLLDAIEHMTQGVCVFDRNERLVFCNQRFIEIYGMSPDIVHRGAALADILQHRVSLGSLTGKGEDYRAKLTAAMAKGETTTGLVESAKGRIYSVINKPLPGGGWVGTHMDITERRKREQEEMANAVEQNRRASIDSAIASFRDRIEALLKTVADSAVQMSATASSLSAASGQTSQRAEGAALASNEA